MYNGIIYIEIKLGAMCVCMYRKYMHVYMHHSKRKFSVLKKHLLMVVNVILT